MIRRALLLGFYSIGGQVLLLRELVASLNGDELFISTALFGWLVAVAVGAWQGGRSWFAADSKELFIAGSLLMPGMILVTRLTPLAFVDHVGQFLPFTTAALLSVVMMFPVGIVSGWLFPVIAREGTESGSSIVRAYLFEGIGAFAGGLLIVLSVGSVLSALQAAVAVAAIILLVAIPFEARTMKAGLVSILVVIIGVGILYYATARMGAFVDRLKYRPFTVDASFDTRYGRQTLLSREGESVLVTDNSIEAVYIDYSVTEDHLIPPLVYHPQVRQMLYFGRSEFGIEQLFDSLPCSSLVSVDPRQELTDVVDQFSQGDLGRRVVNADPISYLSSPGSVDGTFDVVVVAVGAPDSYKISRCLTPAFFDLVKSRLSPGGIVVVPASYDTDSHVSREESRVLSLIFNALGKTFQYTHSWPGSQTLMFGSDSLRFDIPLDTILARIDALEYQPQFVSADYLVDRLGELKKMRLTEALQVGSEVSTVERPLLPPYQALYRAKADSFDDAVITFVVSTPVLIIAVPALIVVSILFILTGPRRKVRFPLVLYFVAGLASLSLELVAFYVYQSSMGSLYTEMAILIGSFMLGLAIGTFLTSLTKTDWAGYPALVMLLAVTIAFRESYQLVPGDWMLVYHMCFLLVTAAATGALFVAATRYYYSETSCDNRGTGYAFEIAGSSVGALFSTAVLLPAVGLSTLLLGLAAVVGLAILGLIVSR